MKSRLYFLIMCSLIAYQGVKAQHFVGYQEPDGVQSQLFEVFIDENPIFVHDHSGLAYTGDWNSFHYAFFEFTGTVSVRISLNTNASNWSFSPENNDINVSQLGNDFIFELSQPTKLLLWNKDDRMTHKLAFFAAPPQDNVPDPTEPTVVNINDYNTLQEAIDDVSQFSKGGTIFVPPGIYEGATNFKSNVSLYLSPGSVITSPIFGSEVENVTIYGRGVFKTEVLTDAVRFEYATNVHLEGFVVVDGGVAILFDSFQSIIYDLKNFRITERAQTLDANGTNDLLVDNCFFWSSDDATAIGYRHDQTNVTVRNSLLGIWATGTCMKVAAGYRLEQIEPKYKFIGNYTYENCTCVIADRMAQIRQDCGGDVQNFYIKNTQMEYSFFTDSKIFGIQYSNFNDPIAQLGYGQMGNMNLANISFPDGYINLRGLGENHQIDGVLFNNVWVGNSLINNLNQPELQANEYVQNVAFENQTQMTLVEVDIETAIVEEGPENSKFIFRRSGSNNSPVTIPFTIRGTATKDVDFLISQEASITFPSGIDEVEIDVEIICDTAAETTETIHLILENSDLSLDWSLNKKFDAVIYILNNDACNLSSYSFNTNTFSVYPNPANDIITISFSQLLNEHSTFKILDVVGKTVIPQQSITDITTEVSIATLKTGLYFIEVGQGSNKVIKRFIKQ